MEKRLYFLLNLAQHALRKHVDGQSLKRLGLTSAQMGVLQFLARRESCTLGELAVGIGVKNAAITGLMARTERTGCIVSRKSREDARATEIVLTTKGRDKVREVKALNHELNAQLRGGFSDDEIDVVLRFLEHVLTNVAGQAPPPS